MSKWTRTKVDKGPQRGEVKGSRWSRPFAIGYECRLYCHHLHTSLLLLWALLFALYLILLIVQREKKKRVFNDFIADICGLLINN